MKKLLFILLLFLASCDPTRSIMTSWIGYSKHDVILQWGANYYTVSDGADGEIITYSATSNIYIPFNGTIMEQPRTSSRSFYINSEGKVYQVSWNN